MLRRYALAFNLGTSINLGTNAEQYVTKMVALPDKPSVIALIDVEKVCFSIYFGYQY